MRDDTLREKIRRQTREKTRWQTDRQTERKDQKDLGKKDSYSYLYWRKNWIPIPACAMHPHTLIFFSLQLQLTTNRDFIQFTVLVWDRQDLLVDVVHVLSTCRSLLVDAVLHSNNSFNKVITANRHWIHIRFFLLITKNIRE